MGFPGILSQLTCVSWVLRKLNSRLCKLKRVCKMFWGISRHTMHLFYVSAILPVMNFAALSWSTITSGRLRSLAKIQRRAPWWLPVRYAPHQPTRWKLKHNCCHSIYNSGKASSRSFFVHKSTVTFTSHNFGFQCTKTRICQIPIVLQSSRP